MKFTNQITINKQLININEKVYALFHDCIKEMKVIGYEISESYTDRIYYKLSNIDDSLISNGIEDTLCVIMPIDTVFITKEEAYKEFRNRISDILFSSSELEDKNLSHIVNLLKENPDIEFEDDYIEKANEVKEFLDIIISRKLKHNKK